MTPPRTVAIIPARGGSKGVHRKNLREVCGVPLIGHVIHAAKRAKLVDAVVVSTEDEEIERMAISYGAHIVRRPPDIARDDSSSESALLHALDALRKAGSRVDTVAFVQCTSPLTLPEDIDGTIRAVHEGADCAFTATPFHRFVWRAEASGPRGVNHDPAVRPRRQDRTPEWVETGAVYAFRADGFELARHRFFGSHAMHVVPTRRSWEVDDEADLELVRTLMQQDGDGPRPWITSARLAHHGA